MLAVPDSISWWVWAELGAGTKLKEVEACPLDRTVALPFCLSRSFRPSFFSHRGLEAGVVLSSAVIMVWWCCVRDGHVDVNDPPTTSPCTPSLSSLLLLLLSTDILDISNTNAVWCLALSLSLPLFVTLSLFHWHLSLSFCVSVYRLSVLIFSSFFPPHFLRYFWSLMCSLSFSFFFSFFLSPDCWLDELAIIYSLTVSDSHPIFFLDYFFYWITITATTAIIFKLAVIPRFFRWRSLIIESLAFGSDSSTRTESLICLLIFTSKVRFFLVLLSKTNPQCSMFAPLVMVQRQGLNGNTVLWKSISHTKLFQ